MKDIKKVLKLIEESKTKIGKERDILRSLNNEIEDLLESLDSGLESIESGKREIESGLEYLSQQV